MEENFIQLKKSDILRLGIRDADGNPTGEYLEFDLEDIELPLKYQELLEKDKRNREWLRKQFVIIDKKQDVKSKTGLSKNDEEKVKVMNSFLKREVEIYNLFLGENGVQKLLNGQKLKWTTLKDIDEIVEKQIKPYLDKNMKSITEKVKEKYGQTNIENKEVLK